MLSNKRRNNGTLDVLLCGTRRSGTSSLLYYLNEHPAIHFLDNSDFRPIGGVAKGLPFDSPLTAISCRKDVDDVYAKLAAKHPSHVECLGWRVLYSIYFPHIIENISEQLPNIKLLFSIRDPADTSYSIYCRQWERTGTTDSFNQFMRSNVESPDMSRQGWARYYDKPSDIPNPIARGFYYTGLKRFMDFFPRERIYAISFSDLISSPQDTLRGILRFLEVDDNYTFTRTSTIKSPSKKPQPMTPESRAVLNEIFREPNRKLFDLLGWPHDIWGPAYA